MALIPNAASPVIDRHKLVYLLQDNPGKAKFFLLYGFHPNRPEELERSLRQHVLRHPYVRMTRTVHGTKYEVRCSMPAPDGRDPCVRTIWIIDAGEHVPRLVTSYADPPPLRARQAGAL